MTRYLGLRTPWDLLSGGLTVGEHEPSSTFGPLPPRLLAWNALALPAAGMNATVAMASLWPPWDAVPLQRRSPPSASPPGRLAGLPPGAPPPRIGGRPGGPTIPPGPPPSLSRPPRRTSLWRTYFVGFGLGCVAFTLYIVALFAMELTPPSLDGALAGLFSDRSSGSGIPLVSPDVKDMGSPLDTRDPSASGAGDLNPVAAAPDLASPDQSSTARPEPTTMDAAVQPRRPDLGASATKPIKPVKPKNRARDLYDRGLTKLMNGEHAAAIELFNDAIAERGGGYAAAWRSLALAYEKVGNRALAQAAYSRYLALSPNAPDRDLIQEKIEKLQ